MEKVVLDSRSERLILGKTCSNFLRGRGRFSNWLCSSQWKVFPVKASYATTRISSENIEPIAPKMFLRSDSSDMKGFNDSSCLWTSPTNDHILDAYEDEYGGIIINPDRLPWETNAFGTALQASLSYWKLMGKKGVWLKLPLDRSEYVPIAVKEGFKYHHAEEAYVMLTYWIPDGPCMLPANASHQVGVGGFVINDQNEVLVVQEKYCASSLCGVWKLPTGFIHESEEIFAGAVREVKEETGIDTEFVEVIAFRHAHHVAFEKSDLFFVCMLRPLSHKINIDDMEVQAAKWMPLAEFLEQPCIQDDSMFKRIIDICIARLGKRYCGLAAHHMISKFDGRSSCLYYNVAEPQDFNCQGT
ncbi:nudix hydrolase 8-like [Typha angustifolia]|uniref:nudix hydrolase 8-like n=1 Tax=Typha angustifolia TaxID=59011 RepID=UPI003C2BBB5F